MRISNVKKKFEKFSLNWDKEDTFEKKIYGIIGSNGCGKTTMLKVMAGLVKADSGQIDYQGLSTRDITMVFRKPYMLHDTVYKNLVYPLKLRKTVPDNKQIDFYLDMAGLTEMREQYAPSLSSGEQQKLSFIRALIFSPKIILVDEAFSNMDIESVVMFENHIIALQKKEPVTWVVVSHQLSNINRLCDYVYFMHKGKPTASGNTQDILKDHKNSDLQKYLQYSSAV